MGGVEDFIAQMARATKRVPGHEELEAAANRAAKKTNDQLRRNGYDQRAVVLGRGAGYRVELHTIGRGLGRRGIGNMSPQQLLEANVRAEVRTAAKQTAERGLGT